MALKLKLFESIAALERIAGADAESRPTAKDSRSSPPPPSYREREKVASCSASIASSRPYEDSLYRFSRSQFSLRTLDTEKVPEGQDPVMEGTEMDASAQRRRNIMHIFNLVVEYFALVLAFLNPAISVVVIGLCADNMEWATGRGSEEANTVKVRVLTWTGNDWNGTWHNGVLDNYYDQWTRMFYIPWKYDTRTFSGLIAAASVCILCACVVVPLSIILTKSRDQSVRLGRKPNKYLPTMRLTTVVLDAFQLLVSFVVIICARELFNRSIESLKYQHTLDADFFYPKLIPGAPEDDIIRHYDHPAGWTPLSWNCGLQGWTHSPQQHRIFQLCTEGLAARTLFLILFSFQFVVLASHAWVWWIEKKGRTPWMGQRLESEEQLPDINERSE